MWKINRSKVLIDDTSEEENNTLQQQTCKNKDPAVEEETASPVSQLASKVQGAGFRGWKEMTSLFNKDDEHQLLTESKPAKVKGPGTKKCKEEVKSERRSSFWDSVGIKQISPTKKPDESEGWEPTHVTEEDTAKDNCSNLNDSASWPGWEDETRASSKYTNLAASGNPGSRWSIKSAGKLVSMRRRSKGNLTDNWEELE
ncbi:testis development-related protein [Acipenser oxyrinchus oxyrinchus]|uniref:Testis development-related protein n=1 Tax=Acipenser oxyrinchus oxyrinchus TaxID=40147 RepID=A0AAD8LM86_ACIOX|nr:testis development-related protein [Acipenser oxyrinchus oxyrinchus]